MTRASATGAPTHDIPTEHQLRAESPSDELVLQSFHSPQGRGLRHGRARLLMLTDLASVSAALALAYAFAHHSAPPAVIAPGWLIVVMAVLAPIAWIGVFAAYGLYERQTRSLAPGTFDEIGTLFHALLAGALLGLLSSQVTKHLFEVSFFTPVEATLMVASALALVPLARIALRAHLLPSVMRPRRALIVGSGAVERQLERKLAEHPEYGLELVGFVDDETADGPLLGHTSQLSAIIDEHEIDWVILAFTNAPFETTLDLLRTVRRPDVRISIVPRYFEMFASNATIEDLGGMPLVSLPPLELSRTVHAVKRIVDATASAGGLLVLSPLLALTALLIKLDSRGPVLFRQERRGRHGTTFRIIKFRTMVRDAEAQRSVLAEHNDLGDGPLFKLRDDHRVTRVGRVLRRLSLDELPQLVNVLKGEMSLVGPRPFVVHEAEQITGWAGRRVDLTPGITGLWQISGRNDLSFDEMVKLDYVYVTNWSLWWDVKILCRTIPAVFAGKGAY